MCTGKIRKSVLLYQTVFTEIAVCKFLRGLAVIWPEFNLFILSIACAYTLFCFFCTVHCALHFATDHVHYYYYYKVVSLSSPTLPPSVFFFFFFSSFFSNRSNPFIGVPFYFWKWCVIWLLFFILNFKRLCMTVPWNGHTTVSSLLLARPVFHMGAFCFLLQGLKTVKHTEKVKYMMLNMHSLLLTDLGMSE